MLPCSKPEATEIVLLGSAFSLDIAPPEAYSRNADRIVIGMNGGGMATECDYIATNEYVAHNVPHVINMLRQYLGLPDQWLILYDRNGLIGDPGLNTIFLKSRVFRRFALNGTVAIGFWLAYLLYKQLPCIKRITYIGVDFSCYYASTGDVYYYSHLMQPHYQAYWKGKMDYGVFAPASVLQLTNGHVGLAPATPHAFYRFQLAHVLNFIYNYDPGSGFRDALVSRSFIDLNVLTPISEYNHDWCDSEWWAAQDCGYSAAGGAVASSRLIDFGVT